MTKETNQINFIIVTKLTTVCIKLTGNLMHVIIAKPLISLSLHLSQEVIKDKLAVTTEIVKLIAFY